MAKCKWCWGCCCWTSHKTGLWTSLLTAGLAFHDGGPYLPSKHHGCCMKVACFDVCVCVFLRWCILLRQVFLCIGDATDTRALISTNSLSNYYYSANSNPAVCKSVSHDSVRERDTGRTGSRAVSRFFFFFDCRDALRKKGKTNVQSTRTSVMHLLQSFWFIIDLGAAQHLCCWPPNIVQGHFDSRCWGTEVHFSSTYRPLLFVGPRWGFKPETFLATSSFL